MFFRRSQKSMLGARPGHWQRQGSKPPILILILLLVVCFLLVLDLTLFLPDVGQRQAASTYTATLTPVTQGQTAAQAAFMPIVTPSGTAIADVSPTPDPKMERIALLWQELDRSWAKADWPTAIAILEQVRALSPSYDDLEEKLFAAHFNYGVYLVSQNLMERAVIEFTAALEVSPDDINAQGERRFALLYIQGSRRYDAHDWEGAIRSFQEIFEDNPDYKDTRQLLYASHYNAGRQLEQAGDLAQARSHYIQALQIDPKGSEAQAGLARITAALKPPTPTPVPPPTSQKRIEVNLSTFRAIAWEGNRQVYNFLIAHGEPGRATAPGNYRILDKIPMAYASTWGLKMPYWMGIYWAGNLENGFHALPINRYGQKMWAGYLGRRVTYGCIVLGDEDARKLYEWAEVGIPVYIHY